MKGLSTISCPIQPRLNALQKKNQKKYLLRGLKYMLRKKDVSTRGRNARMIIAIPIRRTPPSLSGIVRRTA
jgi:hypothetical protein